MNLIEFKYYYYYHHLHFDISYDKSYQREIKTRDTLRDATSVLSTLYTRASDNNGHNILNSDVNKAIDKKKTRRNS